MLSKYLLLLLVLCRLPLSAQGDTTTLDSIPPVDTITVGYKISPPFIIEEKGKLEGPSIWLWKEVSKAEGLIFRYEERSLDGLMKGLEDGSLDLSINPLTITSHRAERFDFSHPYYIAHSGIMSKAPSSWEKLSSFLSSFLSANFFRALGALAFVILIFGWLEWLFERRHNTEEFGKGWKGLWNGFWWSAVTMTTVGYGDKSPQTVGGRIVALIWMFTAIIIISGFTASIASSLTVDQLGWSRNSIEDFKESAVGTVRGSSTDRWLREHFYNSRKGYASIDEMLDALRKEKVVAVSYDKPILQSLLKNEEDLDFELLPIRFNPQFYAMGFGAQLSETQRDLISQSVLQVTERIDWQILLSEYSLEMQ